MINKISPILRHLPHGSLLFGNTSLPRLGDVLCLHPSTREKGKGKCRGHQVRVTLRRVPSVAGSSGGRHDGAYGAREA